MPRVTGAQDAPRWKRSLGPALKVALVLILFIGIQRTLSSAWSELAKQRLTLSPGWLAASAGFYLIGLLPAAWFWYWLLRSLGQPVTRFATFRAHYIGHLGKYVPGKAMVFVIRLGLLPASQRSIGAASLAVFYETITLMAEGACLGAILLVAWLNVTGLLALFAIGVAVAGVLCTLPPLLSRLGGVVQWLKPNWALGDELKKIHWQHVVVGWIANLAVWLMFGLSFWATLRSMAPASVVSLTDYPFYLASVALAVVAGFASMIPGGALVREAVLLELLEPRLGGAVALAAAVVLRGVWLVSELVLSVILYVIGLKVLPAASADPDN